MAETTWPEYLKDAMRRNLAYAMEVNGKNIFWFPFETLGEFKAKPALSGNPFLWPWANRIDQDAYWVNGKRYLLNPDLGNLRRDGNQKPIHGLLMFSPYWQIAAMTASGESAQVTSKLDFRRYPELMAQFPFAHTVEMTYRLQNGVLEVETVIINEGAEALPVAAGYHPYFRLHDTPRDSWKVHVAAREHVVLSELLVPTGERKPVSFKDPQPLAGTKIDDVFTGLIRGGDGRAHFYVAGSKEKISVLYGPKYTVAIVYAPSERDFICFEPMAAVTNAFNLAHKGKFKELQTVPPGGQWRESFWIAPGGF
jgi:aldose 1-epimerase